MFKNLLLVTLMLFAWPSLAAADELSGYQMPTDQLVVQAQPLMDGWPDGDGADHVARCITVTGEITQLMTTDTVDFDYTDALVVMPIDRFLPLEVGWRSHPDI